MVDTEVLAALDLSEKTLRDAAAKPGCGVCKTLVAQEADNVAGLKSLMVTTAQIAESGVMLQSGNAKAGAMLAQVNPSAAPPVVETVKETTSETAVVHRESFREKWRIIPEGGLGLRDFVKDRPKLGSVIGGR